jgi:adenylate cyclase
MIPVERELRGEGGHTMREVADTLGLDLDHALEVRRALALPVPDDPDAPVLSEAEVDLARQGRALLDAGVPAESFIEISRVMSQAMGTVAAAFANEWAEWMRRAGDTERDLGLRYAESLRALGPAAGPALENMFMLRLREQVRQAVVDQAQLESGTLPGAQPVVVAFADLVGFTRLGESLPPEDLAAVVRRFDRLVEDVVAPPVRLVKTLGDGVMLVSTDTDAMLGAALRLGAGAEADEVTPALRVGLAAGDALARAGDWYGRPVNLASRLSSFARPGSVVATEAVKDDARREYGWSFTGRRRFKGIVGEIPVFRVRPATG